jgi:serine/threonine protein phosphatase 1
MKTFAIGDVHGRARQLRAILAMLPRDEEKDTLVLLGDLIDRGEDAPGVVAEVIKLQSASPDRVVALRGNHEQMLLDFVEDKSDFWLTHVTGCERTFEQYTGFVLPADEEDDGTIELPSVADAREKLLASLPPAHLEFFRALPLYYEDEYAIYVHAGLDKTFCHPSESDPDHLLWSRSPEFFKNYTGKPCVFGHTPTPLLPLMGRLGHYGIYMSHSAVGIDTSGHSHSPLSCLSLPDFTLYQSYPDGSTARHQITAFLPDTLRALRRQQSGGGGPIAATK